MLIMTSIRLTCDIGLICYRYWCDGVLNVTEIVLIHIHTLSLCIILFHFSLQYDVRGADSSFFVDDSRIADKLASVDKKIMTFKGFRVCYDLVVGVCVCIFFLSMCIFLLTLF